MIAVLGALQLLFSFVGAGIAGTLYYADRAHVDLPCSSGGGCELVASSHWAVTAGVPTALVGLIAYCVLTILSAAKLTMATERSKPILQYAILSMSFAGTFYSWYLQYVAYHFIGAFCIYCRASAITMTLLFAVTIAELVASKRKLSAL